MTTIIAMVSRTGSGIAEEETANDAGIIGHFRAWRSCPLSPENEDEGDPLVLSDGLIMKQATAGECEKIAIGEIDMILILTCATGVLDLDSVWMLTRLVGGPPFLFAHDATGADRVVEELTALSDFDHAGLLEAMGSSDKQRFLLWRRGPR